MTFEKYDKINTIYTLIKSTKKYQMILQFTHAINIEFVYSHELKLNLGYIWRVGDNYLFVDEYHHGGLTIKADPSLSCLKGYILDYYKKN